MQFAALKDKTEWGEMEPEVEDSSDEEYEDEEKAVDEDDGVASVVSSLQSGLDTPIQAQRSTPTPPTNNNVLAGKKELFAKIGTKAAVAGDGFLGSTHTYVIPKVDLERPVEIDEPPAPDSTPIKKRQKREFKF